MVRILRQEICGSRTVLSCPQILRIHIRIIGFALYTYTLLYSVLPTWYCKLVRIVDGFQTVLHGVDISQLYLIRSDLTVLCDQVSVGIVSIVNGGVLFTVVVLRTYQLMGYTIRVQILLFPRPQKLFFVFYINNLSHEWC